MLRLAPRAAGRPRQPCVVRAPRAASRTAQARAPCAPLILRSFAAPRASFSTDAAAPKAPHAHSRKKNHGIPTLKGQLKKFYKLVHPDLFAAHPDARAANEAALTRLMGVADRFNKQPGGNPFAPPEAHQFNFYIMKKENQKVAVPSGEIPGGRVTITEVEGQPLLRVHFETKINAPYEHTRAAFSRLFESLGIDPEFVLDEPDERVFPPSIEEFFRTYIGHARHKKETYDAQVREEIELVKEIEAKSGADVVNLPEVAEAPLEERLHVLKAFLNVFPKIASAPLLQGQAIAFQAPFTGTYYDREQQVICFDPLADPMQWASFVDLKLTLPQYTNYLRPKREKDQPRAAASFLERMERIKRKTSEVGGAAKRREMSTERRIAEKQEKLIANALGLKSIGFPMKDYNRGNEEEDEEADADEDDLYSSNSSKEMNAYRAFLDRFVKPPALQEFQKYLNANPRRAKAFKNAAIFVREFTLPKRWSVSPEGGLYVASSIGRPAELIATLEEAGPLAATAAAESRKREELRHYVRTRLGLHGMATHRVVFATETDAANKMRAALDRLAGAADSLRELNLRGQTLVLSHKYAISDDGMLFVPWNFQFEPKEPKRLAKGEADAAGKAEGDKK